MLQRHGFCISEYGNRIFWPCSRVCILPVKVEVKKTAAVTFPSGQRDFMHQAAARANISFPHFQLPPTSATVMPFAPADSCILASEDILCVFVCGRSLTSFLCANLCMFSIFFSMIHCSISNAGVSSCV